MARRRLFYGALIADNSDEVIQAVSTEAYGIFHMVSLIESNTTQSGTPRGWRYLGTGRASEQLSELCRSFGPGTRVSELCHTLFTRFIYFHSLPLLIAFQTKTKTLGGTGGSRMCCVYQQIRSPWITT